MLPLLLIAPAIENHPDTVTLDDECFDQPGGLPDVCLSGIVNTCTEDVDLNVTIPGGWFLSDITVPISLGDGTEATGVEGSEQCVDGLLGDLFSLFCEHVCFTLREASATSTGLQACINLRLECGDLIGTVEEELECFTLGEGVSECEHSDQCECVQDYGCGWCESSSSCTRLLLTADLDDPDDPTFEEYPACSCDSGVLLPSDPAVAACFPPPPSPSPPPSRLPLPPPLPMPPPSQEGEEGEPEPEPEYSPGAADDDDENDGDDRVMHLTIALVVCAFLLGIGVSVGVMVRVRAKRARRNAASPGAVEGFEVHTAVRAEPAGTQHVVTATVVEPFTPARGGAE